VPDQRQPILAVGPRWLPDTGVARVWVDTGSGPGHVREVPVERLALADSDDGRTNHAVYTLQPAERRLPAGPDRPDTQKENRMEIVQTKGMTVDLSQADWRKSSRSGAAGHCVQIAFVGQATAVRDSNTPNGPTLIFTSAEWDAFVAGAKDGEFDRAG
jgi:hypothetical protein